MPRLCWVIAAYDRFFRAVHGLNSPAAEVGSTLRVEVRHCRHHLQFADGTTVRPGDRICVLHLNNEVIRALHRECPSPIRVALAFRRQLLASFADLVRLTAPGGRLIGINAFAATTIFHDPLRAIGFEPAHDRLLWPELVALYQRALLAYLHPAGGLRLQGASLRRAERLWISRQGLLQLIRSRRSPLG